jgi:ATP phosphoribosyltransferase regulatory subunit
LRTWTLPENIEDLLPADAKKLERLRRTALDLFASHGYELVMPPLLEHLESLLTGTGEALDLQTFKLVDQLSGRMMGVRADTTPQVARIDAHLLNRQGVARLCYCGPVLHTRPDRPHATREPLQFGAEIYGHAGLEADLEILQLALDCLGAAEVADIRVDLADARIVRSLLAGVPVDAAVLAQVHAALAAKDASELASLTANFPAASRDSLQALVTLYGDEKVLIEAKKALRSAPALNEALSNLKWLAAHLPGVPLSFDLADLRGYAYYSGMRFGIYAPGASDALVRGGRYDEVGAVFGRNRAAVGFSLDVKEVVGVVPPHTRMPAIRAPSGEDGKLRASIAALRGRGEVVMCMLPGHESEGNEFECDRELVEVNGQWVVKAIR